VNAAVYDYNHKLPTVLTFTVMLHI